MLFNSSSYSDGIPWYILIVLFFTHWVGDFVLQSSDMARQKSSSLYWLSIHVFTYSILLFIGSLLIMAWKMALTFALINGLIHWVVDFFTSKISARYFEAGNYRFFFIVVGFDQLIHQVTLVSVLVLIH